MATGAIFGSIWRAQVRRVVFLRHCSIPIHLGDLVVCVAGASLALVGEVDATLQYRRSTFFRSPHFPPLPSHFQHRASMGRD